MGKIKLEFHEVRFLIAVINFARKGMDGYPNHNTTAKALSFLAIASLDKLDAKLAKRCITHRNKPYDLKLDIITASSIIANQVNLNYDAESLVYQSFYIRLLTACEQVIINN